MTANNEINREFSSSLVQPPETTSPNASDGTYQRVLIYGTSEVRKQKLSFEQN